VSSEPPPASGALPGEDDPAIEPPPEDREGERVRVHRLDR
jgi:hypothetical protein